MVETTHKNTRADKGEVIGGGFFVARRDSKGRVMRGNKPFEHGSSGAAYMEAKRLAGQNPGTLFVVLEVVDAVCEPAVDAPVAGEVA